jgi:hypothetical protein
MYDVAYLQNVKSLAIDSKNVKIGVWKSLVLGDVPGAKST